MVDRYSGYIWTKQMTTTTTKAMTNVLDAWLSMFGIPQSIRTDGGPQFRGEFGEWCEKKGIKHELSSAYNPNSNGLAEAAVKSTKYLVEKCREAKEDLQAALLEARCTPRADGVSPAEAMFARRPRTMLPRIHTGMGDKLSKIRAMKTKKTHDAHSAGSEMSKFCKGDKVVIQDAKSGRWVSKGVITKIRDSGRSYEIDSEGWTTVRARKFLKRDI